MARPPPPPVMTMTTGSIR